MSFKQFGGKFVNGAATAAIAAAVSEGLQAAHYDSQPTPEPTPEPRPPRREGKKSGTRLQNLEMTRDGDNISFFGNIAFKGDGFDITDVNTSELVFQLKQSIISDMEGAWTGTFGRYNVNMDLTVVDNLNEANVVVNYDSSVDRSVMYRIFSRFNKTIYLEIGQLVTTPAHELGHVMGLHDQYFEWTNPVTGRKYSVPFEGWRGNIMSTGIRGRRFVEERNIRTLLGD